MMGRQTDDQGHLFYDFRLDEAVPDDDPVRRIAAVLDLSWVYGELAPYYPALGRPSIDPVLMLRMLITGYVFGIRSERLLCREVQVNFAYRWFCKLGIEPRSPITRYFRERATSGSGTAASSAGCWSVSWRPVSQPGWLAEKGLPVDASLIEADANSVARSRASRMAKTCDRQYGEPGHAGVSVQLLMTPPLVRRATSPRSSCRRPPGYQPLNGPTRCEGRRSSPTPTTI